MAKHISSLMPSLVAESAGVSVTVVPLRGRMSVRARKDLTKISAALGVKLPGKIGGGFRSDDIEVVCLGPDEWTIVMPAERLAAAQDALAALYTTLPHAATDITGREVTFSMQGPQAATLLSIGCPRDIRTIEPGQARRTVFDGVTVVIWCDAPDSYRMDVWNSFAPFVAQTLETGTRELAAEHETL